MIYLDTSAFLKLYIREPESEYVQECVIGQDDPLPVGPYLQTEFFNALMLKVFWNEIDFPTVDHLIALFDDRLRRGQYHVAAVDYPLLLEDCRKLVRHTPKIGCRTLDILHVATALQLTPESFITYDARQRALARAAGLSILPSSAP